MAADLTKLENTSDLWTVEDFRAHMPMVYGREATAQRLLRKITTAPGTLPFPEWDGKCIDVRDFLLSTASPADIQRAVARVCLQDEMVERINVLAEFDDDGSTINLSFLITDSEGPWQLSLSISQAAATLVSLQAST